MRKRILKGALVLPFIFGTFTSLQSREEKGIRVFISADMEGIGGVVHSDQVSSAGKDYDRARRSMTEEVNAAIEGALEAGATEILVNDSHGNMRNILVEYLNERAELISGSPKPLSMMQGIDSTFDLVFFIGYHARAGTENGVLDHTYSSSTVSNITINGQTLSEAGINAAVAGYYGVPVGLVAGDSAAVNQAKRLLGDVEAVMVKEGIGRTAARVLPPEKVRELIREAAVRAVRRRGEFKPFKIKPPVKVEIDLLKSSMADRAELIPGARRTNGRSVAYTHHNLIEAFKALRAMIALAYEK